MARLHRELVSLITLRTMATRGAPNQARYGSSLGTFIFFILPRTRLWSLFALGIVSDGTWLR